MPGMSKLSTQEDQDKALQYSHKHNSRLLPLTNCKKMALPFHIAGSAVDYAVLS